MSISVGLNCPACGGAIQISEGENVLNCNYCGSLLWAEGDAGVMTVAFRNAQGRDSVLRATEEWWRTARRMTAPAERAAATAAIRRVVDEVWRDSGRHDPRVR